MPQPLDPSDAALVRRVFALQDHGKLTEADRLLHGVQNRLLLGEILADRYLGPYHRSTVAELQDWLKHYAELPDAAAIRALLLRRAGPGTTAPPLPPPQDLALPHKLPAQPAEDPDPEPGVTRNPALDRAVASRLEHGEPQSALRLIAATHHLSPSYGVLLRAEVARALFAVNDNVEALRLAVEAEHAVPMKDRVGRGYYVAGLAAWRLGRVESARTLFEAAARAPVSTAAIRAGAAFWTSRADLRLHARAAALQWMRKAALEHRTLYGLLARRVLGLHTGIIPSGSLLTQADVDAVAAVPAGDRAFALLEVGETRRAEAELREAWAQVKDDPGMRRSVLLVAASAGLRDLAGHFAMLEAEADGTQPAAPSELPRLRPAHGFRIDPALVYAVTRMESNFNANAVSAAGARGLMQIMPVTARYVAGNPSLSSAELHNPGLNLALGQRYLRWLAQQSVVDDNLLYLLASYNAGAGNLAGWLRGMHDQGDPLLFLEAIPVPETRAFVTEVLAYTWRYAARLHVPAPSLDALAAGEFPRFTPLAKRSKLQTAKTQTD
ncbi:MAG TPA: lytic transglycosylase domain-containing protein [Acetobacteraceae bacterium]|nr:lytic transglycosylase domain-containing protein [Acetobacteraceae bacterium]